MSIWFTADWHLGETRLPIMNRGIFEGPEEMDRVFRLMHNDICKVQKDDLVYVIGDVLYRDAPVDEFLPFVAGFNGRKILIRGNHDRHLTDEQLKPLFEEIIPEGEGIELDIEGIPCYLTHYPSQGKKDRFNLVGHIHGSWKHQLNMLNVGVDVHHFCPVNAADIPRHLKAITEFYDEDVWVAYNEINESYRGERGKKGRYFNG
jgi:calcineurin-like phosphoesterase family protein